MLALRRDAKIGIVHFMAFPEVMSGDGPVLDTLRQLLADEYFDVIEVTRINDNAVAREAAQLGAEAHVTFAFGAQPVLLGGNLNLNALDNAERARAVEAVKSCFDQAVLLGAESVAVLSGPCPEGRQQEGIGALAASLTELSRTAADCGLRMTLEVFDDAVDKRSLVGKADIARTVGERVRAECPNFGLMHDLSHMPLLGESPREALEPIQHLLVHMHLGNCILRDASQPGYGDQHPRFGVPGGENDIEEVAACLRTLYDIGYLGGSERRILSFEVKPLPGEDGGMVIAGAKRVLNAAAARITR